MPNVGIAPPDLTSTRGQFRLLAGDSLYEPLTPAQSGFGDYEIFSDAEVDAYLAMTSDDVYRALAIAYLALSNVAAREADSIKDYDLAADRRQKAGELRAQSDYWLKQAEMADMDGEMGFQIVSTGRRLTRPERVAQDVQAILNGDWPI